MTDQQEQQTLPTIERVIVENPEPAHKPPRRKHRRTSSAGSERVKVDDAKAAPRGRAKTIGKTLPKDIESFTVTAFDVAQWVSPFVPALQPSRLPDGSAIWPIDKTDAQELANLKAFTENAAKLINRLPDSIRRYLIVSMSGGAIGAEVIGFIQGLYYLIMSRLITQQMAAAMPAQPDEPTMPVNPWQSQETAAD